MKFSRGYLSAALALSIAALGFTPANAAVNPIFSDSSSEAVGLIVKYEDGVAAKAADGQPTAENASGVDLTLGRDIGNGWHSIAFQKEMTAGAATKIALRMASDPRVASVDLDRKLVSSSSSSKLSSKQIARALAALKPATPVRSLRGSDGWSKSAPATPAAKLTWQPPASTYGAVISGYRIQIDDGSGWRLYATALATTATFKQELSAGVPFAFRVAAITRTLGGSKIGTYSSPVKVVPTVVPQVPVVDGSPKLIGSYSPAWVPLNLKQSGGLPVLEYKATATASGQPTLSCTAPPTAVNCKFNGLVSGANYTVTFSARNARGSSDLRGAAQPINAGTPGDTKLTMPTDPLMADQWYLTAKYGINVKSAWQRTLGSSNIVVGVIDSGITSHPDLDNQVVPGYDFVSDPASSNDGDGWDSNNSDPGDYYGTETSSWHGTHVAGIIAAQANSIGVVGIAPSVKIQPIRALGTDGGNSSDLIAALRWAAGFHVAGVPDNKTPVQVVNLSMGTDTYTPCRVSGQTTGATEVALAELQKAGITVISAAGNYNVPAYQSYPGNCFPTINVGATAFSGDRASYSNYSVLDNSGQMVGVDISAPGGDSRNPGDAPAGTNGKIVSTLNDGLKGPGAPIYRGEEGTSMAAPVVTGVVALMYSIRPKMSFDSVWEVLKSTVTPFPSGSQCDLKKYCGAGIVNAGAALAATAAIP